VKGSTGSKGASYRPAAPQFSKQEPIMKSRSKKKMGGNGKPGLKLRGDKYGSKKKGDIG